MATPDRSDSGGLSWADQWDYKNQDSNSGNSGSNSKSKVTAYNQRMKAAASTGLGKAKSAAAVGAQKVKSGTLTGVKWIKERMAKSKSKS